MISLRIHPRTLKDYVGNLPLSSHCKKLPKRQFLPLLILELTELTGETIEIDI